MPLNDFLARRLKSPDNPNGWEGDNEFVLLLKEASAERVNGWQAQAGGEPTISVAKLKQYLRGSNSGRFLTSNLMVELSRAMRETVAKAPERPMYQPEVGPPAPREVAQQVRIADLPEHWRGAAAALDVAEPKGQLSPGEVSSLLRTVRQVSNVTADSVVVAGAEDAFC